MSGDGHLSSYAAADQLAADLHPVCPRCENLQPAGDAVCGDCGERLLPRDAVAKAEPEPRFVVRSVTGWKIMEEGDQLGCHATTWMVLDSANAYRVVREFKPNGRDGGTRREQRARKLADDLNRWEAGERVNLARWGVRVA